MGGIYRFNLFGVNGLCVNILLFYCYYSVTDVARTIQAAKALSALYVLHAAPAHRKQFRHHADRWNAYLAAIATRARAYLDQGARGEARAILQPLLPHLDEFDPATQPLRALSAQLTPVTYSPGTSELLNP